MGGNITDDGGVAVTERGVVYSLTDNTPVIGETDVTKANQGTTGAGSFSATINGLSRGATYYVRAYATNSAGTVYGSTESFTTKNYPVVVTSVAASVKIHSVVLGGDVTNDGGLTVTDRGFVFSSTDGTPTIEEDATKYAVGEGSGSFSSTISGLIAGTTYYFNTYVINSEGIVYGTPGSTTTASSSTFTGTADWNSDVNWSSGVPLTGGTAVIQGNPTIRDAKITVDKLKIYSGSVSLSVVNQLKIVHELYVDKNSSGIVITGN
ncbi:MAG: hypothetical protein PHP53_20530 [Prolixibacteraceae bacterium]|nr:hypothetical protein [Prolixibacteraceae bacterium]